MKLLEASDTRAFAEVWKWMHKPFVLCIGFLLITIVILQILTPVAFGWLIDQLQNESLVLPILFFVGYAILVGAGRIFEETKSILSRIVEIKVVHASRIHFFDNLLGKKISTYRNFNGAELAEIVANLQTSYRTYIHVGFGIIFPSVIEICLTSVLLGIVLNVYVGLLVAVYGAAIIIITHYSNEAITRAQKSAVAGLRKSAFILGDFLNSILSIKTSQAEGWVLDRYKTINFGILADWREFHIKRFLYSIARAIAFTIQLALLLASSVYLFNSGQLTIGELVMFNGLLLQLNQPAERLSFAMESILSARHLRTGYEQLMSFSDENDGFSQGKKNELHLQEAPTISVEGLEFGYKSGELIFDNFHAKFSPERINFLVGPSGAGKSTLLGILVGLISTKQGDIIIDGEKRTQFAENSFLKQVSYVPQNSEILTDTIWNNITMGRSFSTEEVDSVISKVGLSEKISSLEAGTATIVGKSGVELSGGEKHRICIARALITSPMVMLLDEPSSSLDVDTERHIFDELRALCGKMTIITATHRTQVIRDIDQVTQIATLRRAAAE